MTKYSLNLYISGKTEKAEKAIQILQKLCQEDLKGQYTLQIFDVLENPQLAQEKQILATPLVIKTLPLPLRRVIGDLSDINKVILGLDISPNPNKE